VESYWFILVDNPTCVLLLPTPFAVIGVKILFLLTFLTDEN
jgi:hypothetical protein